MNSLRDQLTSYLKDWRADLSEEWSDFFSDAEPDLSAVSAALVSDSGLPVIPGRRLAPLHSAPQGAHVFRAFDGVSPKDVSVVVIGQDPYPRVTRATGRAFEDGALVDWNGAVAVSLQRLMQSVVELRYGRPDLALVPSGWKNIQAGMATGTFELEPQQAYFDRLQEQHGVLFINAGWTLTRFSPGGSEEQKAHIAMWRPLMVRLLNAMAARQSGTVFLLLGGFAQRLYLDAGIGQLPPAAGAPQRIASVSHPHPNARGPSGYLASGNPLAKVNAALLNVGRAPVDW